MSKQSPVTKFQQEYESFPKKRSHESVGGIKQEGTEVQGPITELSGRGVTCPPTWQQTMGTK